MAKNNVYTLRCSPELLELIDKCPGETRTAKIMGIINFATTQGYPGNCTQPDVIKRVEVLEQTVELLLQRSQPTPEEEELPF